MPPIKEPSTFSKDTYLVRERVSLLKLADVYDIYEGDTGQQVAIAIDTVFKEK